MTFWDQVSMDEVLKEAAPILQPSPEAAPPTASSRPPVASPTDPPVIAPTDPPATASTVRRRRHRVSISALFALVGLCAGLLAVGFALSPRVRLEVAQLVAPRPAPAPRSNPEPGPPAAQSSEMVPPLAPVEPAQGAEGSALEISVAGASPADPLPPPVQEPLPWDFENWLQDFDQAQQQAREERKDVLLLFDASDWSDFSRALAREVLGRAEFWERITDRFVPVHIDFPEYPRSQRRVQDRERNRALQARFFKYPAYPRFVLTDAEGRPYAIEWGYALGKAEQFVDQLEIHQQRRQDRDEILANVENAAGKEKLPAAETALNFLGDEVERPTPRDDGTFALDLAVFYAPLLTQWRALADEHDPENAEGYRERFFHADWKRRYRTAKADPDSGAAALRALAEEFDTWRDRCRFKDPNMAADLLSCRAELASRLGDPQRAEKEARLALDLNPSPAWRRALVKYLPRTPRSSRGTGFAVAPGYVVTNDHVVRGPGKVRVRIPGREPVKAIVLAHDEASDLALLEVTLPAQVALPALRVAPAAPAGRGTEVMALGYALDGEILKFTRGAVSAWTDDPTSGQPLLVLDQRINPGNSGGPLCDAYGNVVGLVMAKTISTVDLDSYGIAVGAEALDRFLGRHLADKGYRPSPPLRNRYDWEVIDRWVSPSVVLVIKEPD